VSGNLAYNRRLWQPVTSCQERTNHQAVIPAGIAGIQTPGMARCRNRLCLLQAPAHVLLHRQENPASLRCHWFAVPGRLDSGDPPGTTVWWQRLCREPINQSVIAVGMATMTRQIIRIIQV